LEQLDKPLLGNLKCLKCVAKFGVAFFILVVKAANEYGIKVWWTCRVSKRSVSEQTLGFMLGLSRNLF
jgi:lactate dehydrogenase-like 2-hydroxyacid dehydrogenase